MLRGMRTIACVGRWLLPWLGVLVISSTLAYAANAGLARTWPTTQTGDPAVSPLARPEDASTRWVEIRELRPDGTIRTVDCLTKPDYVAGDALYILTVQLDDTIAQLCSDVFIDAARGQDTR